MGRFSLLPKEEQYFSFFSQMTSYIYDAARALVEMLNDKEGDKSEHLKRIKAIEHEAVELHEVVSMLSKPNGMTARLVELHRLENEGDEIYYKAIADLFRSSPDPLNVIKWKDIYEKLEAAVDRCENVANIIESVIIKHT